jgi:sugar phosphate isomerase/epimerase
MSMRKGASLTEPRHGGIIVFKSGRRNFLKAGVLSTASLSALGSAEGGGFLAKGANIPPLDAAPSPPPFKLGLVTYNLAHDWDIDTIIKNCEETGFEGVELRTTHKHGVEISLDKAQRAEVKQRFAASRVRLMSLGTTCEYESPDAAVVEKNIEETRRWCELAQDLGCVGVKVRPNGFPKNVPEDKTLDQIGHALARCGDIARDHGVEIWLEVHGLGTQLPPNAHHILSVANHPSVGACWNSNDTDVVEGSVKSSFDLLKPWIRSCHINELCRTLAPWGGGFMTHATPQPGFPEWEKPYPWRELFTLLRSIGFNRYTYAEVPESCEPVRFMHYYRALWQYHAA